jgi:hypothetical protein
LYSSRRRRRQKHGVDDVGRGVKRNTIKGQEEKREGGEKEKRKKK